MGRKGGGREEEGGGLDVERAGDRVRKETEGGKEGKFGSG